MGLFRKAVKEEAKLRLAITGPSGSGKTYSSLTIATALAQGAPIALIDTEHGSASKYADQFDFDVADMHPPFHPDKFIRAIREAADAGYAIIILDSLTHAWSGTGGLLDEVDRIAKTKTGGNTFAAWKDATPIQNRLIDAIVRADIHVIATLRSKQEHVQDKDSRGKTVIKKSGMAAQQREGFEYEFDVVLDMQMDNEAIVSKTRCPALTGQVINRPGAEVAAILAHWLQGEKRQTPTTDSGNQAANVDDDEVFGPIPTEREREIIGYWQTPADAQAWAVQVGACDNAHEAKASFKKVVDGQGGRLTKENVGAVYVVFARRQLEKLDAARETESEAQEAQPEPVTA